jgi:hypothetical protein
MPYESERRRFGRVELDQPLSATLGGLAVEVADVSVSGFRVIHENRFMPGEKREMVLIWNGREMRFDCHIVRSVLYRLARTNADKTIYQSGVQIDAAIGGSERDLRDFIADRVKRALEEQKANARGIPPIETYVYQVGKGDRYRRCELKEGKWRVFDSTRADQPVDGFTISAELDPQHVDLLCKTYEVLGDEGRRLTRILAELSIRKTEGGTPRKYVP